MKRMNWGKWIFTAFVLFAGFIATLVVVCMKQDVSLVSSAYYQDDLNYQQAYEAMVNAEALPNKPELVMSLSGLSVSYSNFSTLEQGTLTIMRPSDKTADLFFEVKSSADTLVTLTSKTFEKGLYKVRMQWQQSGKVYRIDKTVVL